MKRDKQKENSRKKQIRQTGITLIALVVTIVVLLILAGVTINAVLGDNGIFKTAREAVNKFNEAQQEEEQELANLLNELNNILNDSGDITEPEEPTEPEQPTMPEGWDTSKVTVEVSEDETPVNVPVPIGFTASTVETERKVEDGFVIKQNGTNNEYVWIPANIENMYTEVQTPIKLTGVETTTSIYSKLRGVTGSTPNTTGYREPDLVVGSGSEYDAVASYQTILGASSTKDMADKMVAEYLEIHDSIEQYGGFYIGRYELTGTIGTPTVEKGGTVIVQTNWYNLKKACMSLVDNSEKEESEITAKTTMIYGNQWDEVVAWLATKKYNTEDSSTWGNHSNYNDSVSADKQVTGAGTKVFEAGHSENWKANNIYDFAGNTFEWTQEANLTSFRVSRGGNYRLSGSDYPASDRGNGVPDYDNDPNISTRPTLYISSTEQ